MEPTAAIALIGEEILSGKVSDQNAQYLIGELRELGVRLRYIEVIPDEIQEVAATVKRLANNVSTVFTSGGVGTTHDDVTMAGIAQAFGVALAPHPGLEKRVRAYFGDRLTDVHLRLANAPEGAELVTGDSGTTCVRFRNVYILPGVPSLFRQKFDAIKSTLKSAPYLVARLFITGEEADIAEALADIDERHADVRIGSYPRFDRSDHSILLTFESKNESALRDAFQRALLAFEDRIVRKEDPQ